MISFRFWRRSRLLLLTSFLLIITIIVIFKSHKNSNDKTLNDLLNNKYEKNKRNNLSPKLTSSESIIINVEGGNSKYDPKMVDVISIGKCEACLGRTYCDSIGSVSANTQTIVRNNKIIIRITKAQNKQNKDAIMTLMTPQSELWTHLDRLICESAGLSSSNCIVSSAVANSFMSKSNIFSESFKYHNFMQQFLNNSHPHVPHVFKLHALFSQCQTKYYITHLQSAFDDNNDQYLDLLEQSHLITSLLTFPSYAIHKMLSSLSSTDFQFVKMRGSCGRVMAYDGDYQTLGEFIARTDSLEVIAGVAVQVIQLVDDLQEEDPKWFLLHTKLTSESILVTREGEVFIADLDDVIVLDKSLFNSFSSKVPKPSLLNDRVCNDPCFKKFHEKFETSAQSSSSQIPLSICSEIPYYYGQQMYSMICQNIFSNFASETEHNDNRKVLLRVIPPKDKDNFNDLIRECIYETSPGGRKQAIDEIKDLLKSYLHFEDDNDADANANDDGNDIDDNENKENNNYDDEDSRDSNNGEVNDDRADANDLNKKNLKILK